MPNLDMLNMTTIEKDRDTLVFFGGLQGQMSIPWFEFKGVAGQIDNVNKVFFRDLSQTWYHEVFHEVGQHISSIIASTGEKTRLTFVGNSMGGYAAYMFGCLYGADEIIMFSPQTAIDYKTKVQEFMDTSFEEYISKARRCPRAVHQYFNLRTLKSFGDVYIYFGYDNENDSKHAYYLLPNGVKLFSVNEPGHNVVSALMHQDKLIPILKGEHFHNVS